MDDMRNVVIVASLVCVCTAMSSGALRHYFQFILHLIWIAAVRTFGIWAVESKETSIKQDVSAIFDQLGLYSHRGSFSCEAASCGDGCQSYYFFLPTPTWRSYCLQACMMGYYAYVPSDPSNKLTLLCTQKQFLLLMVAVNWMHGGGTELPPDILEDLRLVFHVDVPSKGIVAQIRYLYRCVRDCWHWFLIGCGCSAFIRSLSNETDLEALVEDEDGLCVVCCQHRRSWRWSQCYHATDGPALVCFWCKERLLRAQRDVKKIADRRAFVVTPCIICRRSSEFQRV